MWIAMVERVVMVEHLKLKWLIIKSCKIFLSLNECIQSEIWSDLILMSF